MTTDQLRPFLEIPYDELEVRNLEAKAKVAQKLSEEQLRDQYRKYLSEEKRIKAVTVCFTDIEGRFHMLDYDKKYLLHSEHSLTFDGSSIRGFSKVDQSDLRLSLDWGSFRWLPSDVFGPGKVIVFGLIKDLEGRPYSSDLRGRLQDYCQQLEQREGLKTNISVECEGFLFQGINAEQSYNAREGFRLVASGGYFNSLPNDPLKLFIDRLAEAQRALGFENEKDHPEVAPSQFELNYRYCQALQAADQVQLYKLTARQVAANLGFTASFLPKPIAGINGSGMHCNISLEKNGVNIFYDQNGVERLSKFGWDFINRILGSAQQLCLVLNPSVNAYRRLDPAFEAPNQIKTSAIDRTSMIRIPFADQKSARIEVRTVAPDANPYMVFYTLLRSGLEGQVTEKTGNSEADILPANIYQAMLQFETSELMPELLGVDVMEKYLERKELVADRCPRELGTIVKTAEIIFHHEVTNQLLWKHF